VPPNLRVVEASAWTNGPKICHCFSAGMPMPVSDTVNLSPLVAVPPVELDVDDHLAAVGELDGVADEVHEHLAEPPRIADDRRGTSAGSGSPVERLLVGARASSLTASSTASRRSNGTRSSDSLRASIFEKSRMSLTRPAGPRRFLHERR